MSSDDDTKNAYSDSGGSDNRWGTEFPRYIDFLSSSFRHNWKALLLQRRNDGRESLCLDILYFVF